MYFSGGRCGRLPFGVAGERPPTPITVTSYAVATARRVWRAARLARLSTGPAPPPSDTDPDKVTEGSAPEQRDPAPALMLGLVVQHVATLAERLGFRGPVIGWVVIEMRAGQNHARVVASGLRSPVFAAAYLQVWLGFSLAAMLL